MSAFECRLFEILRAILSDQRVYINYTILGYKSIDLSHYCGEMDRAHFIYNGRGTLLTTPPSRHPLTVVVVGVGSTLLNLHNAVPKSNLDC